MATTDYHAESLDQLVSQALEIRRTLNSDFLWFRGMGCATYEVLPKIMRDQKTSDEIFEREQRLITRFRQRSVPYWPAGYPQTDWEHLFAMQHYGLPTRLLDWSENLFVATYFALSTVPDHRSHTTCHPIVYVLDPVAWNRSMPVLSEYGHEIHVLTTADQHLEAYLPASIKRRPKSPVAIYGTHNSNRIVAQRGTFVVWGAEVKALTEYNHPSLCRIRLVGDRDQLFADLHTLGFTETMVFPELTSLASELNRLEGWR